MKLLMHPASPNVHAVRVTAALSGIHWSPALRVYVFENYFKQLKGLGAPDLEEIKKNESYFHSLACILDQQLQEREYLTGAQITLADISTASYLMYAEPAQIPLAPYAHILNWLGRLTSLPAWNETVPQ